jgi:hypothetical protein
MSDPGSPGPPAVHESACGTAVGDTEPIDRKVDVGTPRAARPGLRFRSVHGSRRYSKHRIPGRTVRGSRMRSRIYAAPQIPTFRAIKPSAIRDGAS